MWYVIQTLGGKEEGTADMIRKRVSSACLEECFVPKRERMKKFHGTWNQVEEVLFQGYVFVVSDKPKELYEELKGIPRLTKVLGREEEYFFSLSEEDEELVQKMGNQEHKTGISRIMVEEGKQICIIDGPLKSYAGEVVKVNLHKRIAVVEMEFMGNQSLVHLGVEMVEKIEEAKDC